MERIGEDVGEKLDYTPCVFSEEHRVPDQRYCAGCRTLMQALIRTAVIDRDNPTAGVLAQTRVARHADDRPLYREGASFGRAGLAVPASHWAPGSARAVLG